MTTAHSLYCRSWGRRFGIGLMLAAGLMASEVHAEGKAASFIIDANTGHVISATNADEPRYPASLTKMMTLYVVFDLIEQGRLNDATRIKMSPTAAAAQPSKLGLEAGDDLALIDAIKALVTRSANDVAVAVAEHIAGTEEKFAALMTQKARSIGMRGSTFKNASGLPNDAQVTTARDMVTLGLRLHDDFPRHYVVFALKDFRYAGKAHPNHNTMLNSYEGTEGIKTGYTHASGFNLVASVKRGSKHVMGAVFGGHSASSRNQTMKTLLNMALFKASPVRTRLPAMAVAQARKVPDPQPVARPVALAAAAPVAAWTPAVAVAPKVEPSSAVSAENGKGRDVIEIARVRPVLVAPRPPKQAPEVQAASAPGGAVAPSTVEPEPVRGAAAPAAEIKLPPLAAAAMPQAAAMRPAAAPVTSAARMPVAAVVARMPVAAVAAVAPAAQPVTGPARGNPPSTLQQQAANLVGAPAAPAYHLSGPAVALAAGGDGTGVDIQIGAYSSAAEADRQLGLVRSKAADLLGSAAAAALGVTANGKAVWRARFRGFQATAATTVCSELRRRQIDCLVVRAE